LLTRWQVELKTTAEPSGNQQHEALKFERKLLRMWAQSFLLGVPTIVIGYRTQDGRLTRIQEWPTQRIPNIVKQSTWAWDGNVCINFADAFLQFLKSTISGKDGVWRLKKEKNWKYIRIFQVEGQGTGEILKPSFKEHRMRLKELGHSA
jgi:RAT1-interacting protein